MPLLGVQQGPSPCTALRQEIDVNRAKSQRSVNAQEQSPRERGL